MMPGVRRRRRRAMRRRGVEYPKDSAEKRATFRQGVREHFSGFDRRTAAVPATLHDHVAASCKRSPFLLACGVESRKAPAKPVRLAPLMGPSAQRSRPGLQAGSREDRRHARDLASFTRLLFSVMASAGRREPARRETPSMESRTRGHRRPAVNGGPKRGRRRPVNQRFFEVD